MRASFAVVAVVLAGAAMPAGAQQGAELSRAEAHIRAHQYGEARQVIGRWWEVAGDSARGDMRASALYLRAVLSENLEASERDLLRVAVEHPQSPVADRALLRLARFRLAQGDTAGGRVFLDRLVRDHPQSGERDRALALLGRRDPPGATPASAAAGATRRAPPQPAAATRSEAQYPRGVDYTVQVGSFGTVAEAEALRARLRAAGFDAFLARIGGSPRTLVRVGSFRELREAEALVLRLRAAGSPR